MRCIHGEDERFCGHCAGKTLTLVPLPNRPLRYFGDLLVVVLSEGLGAPLPRIMHLRLENTFRNVAIDSLRDPLPEEINDLVAVKRQFRELAKDQGKIFRPRGSLTARERTPIGPPHCHQCTRQLSFQLGSLGCHVCSQYLCICGTCVCGFEGMNYLGNFFARPALTISREDRVNFMRVFQFLT